jgi:hypothetical protein
MFVCLVELVADKRGYTRFNPTRAEGDQPKPDIKPVRFVTNIARHA